MLNCRRFASLAIVLVAGALGGCVTTSSEKLPDGTSVHIVTSTTEGFGVAGQHTLAFRCPAGYGARDAMAADLSPQVRLYQARLYCREIDVASGVVPGVGHSLLLAGGMIGAGVLTGGTNIAVSSASKSISSAKNFNKIHFGPPKHHGYKKY